MILSRDADRIRKEFRAEVVVVSTYLAREDDILITARAVDFTNNDVIASTTVVLTTTAGVGHLLRSRGQAVVYEK
jgi:multisubunit Na+/H+ antiporter MnhB subunit